MVGDNGQSDVIRTASRIQVGRIPVGRDCAIAEIPEPAGDGTGRDGRLIEQHSVERRTTLVAGIELDGRIRVNPHRAGRTCHTAVVGNRSQYHRISTCRLIRMTGLRGNGSLSVTETPNVLADRSGRYGRRIGKERGG